MSSRVRCVGILYDTAFSNLSRRDVTCSRPPPTRLAVVSWKPTHGARRRTRARLTAIGLCHRDLAQHRRPTPAGTHVSPRDRPVFSPLAGCLL